MDDADAPSAAPEGWADDLMSRYEHALDQLREPWRSDLRVAFGELPTADPLYAPTSFWQPGVDAIMSDLREFGLNTFKRWRSAGYFFYPTYSPVWTYAMVDALMPHVREIAPNYPTVKMHSHLIGATEVDADIDVVLAQLDKSKLPLEIESRGESLIGSPPQQYRPFGPRGPSFGKPHLNYLKVLAAASRVVTEPIRSVVEIGGGFGALGEILLGAETEIQYVNVDIPPLSTLAHFYLRSCFPERVILSNTDLAAAGHLSFEPGGACASILSWQLPLLAGSVDLAVNTFSFQEMEPDVVANYASQLARLDVRTVVSMNTRAGKPLATEAAVGVTEQVTSASIAEQFEREGYVVAARIGRPTAPPQAECVVLVRR